jgi:hypothetical protein
VRTLLGYKSEILIEKVKPIGPMLHSGGKFRLSEFANSLSRFALSGICPV